jgi:hypothetical protein
VPAYCYPGSTWKMASVFQYSINGTFPGAHFVNRTEGKVTHAADEGKDEDGGSTDGSTKD